MSAQVFSFLRRLAASRDWSAQELAEFYRVESALIQAGLSVVSARGLTDEDEPWFVFCRAEDDEVIVHFARIDGRYLISAPAYCGTAMGKNFRALLRATIERHPVLQARPKDDNLFVHPAALLLVLVAAALLKSGHAAEAAPAKPALPELTDNKSREVPVASTAAHTAEQAAQYETLILAVITAAISTPVAVETIAMVVPTIHLVDFTDQSSDRSILLSPLDPARDSEDHGSGVMLPSAPPPLAVGTTQMEVSSHQVPHALSQPSAQSGTAVSDSNLPVQMTPLLVTLPVSSGPGVFLPVADPASGAQLQSLAVVSGISKMELDVLHALNLPHIVPYAATLPVAFSAVLQSGIHTNAVTAPVEHAPAAATAAPPPVTTQGAATSTPATDTAHTAVATPSPAPAAPPPDMAAVLIAVEQFQAVAAQPVIVMTTHAAIFYDAVATTANLSAVKSFTFDFGDGFSISLVGLPAELNHAGLHV